MHDYSPSTYTPIGHGRQLSILGSKRHPSQEAVTSPTHTASTARPSLGVAVVAVADPDSIERSAEEEAACPASGGGTLELV